MLLALGSVASRTGQQAAALLLITEVLVRKRLVSMADAKSLINLLSEELPEVQRQVIAQCTLRRKPNSTR